MACTQCTLSVQRHLPKTPEPPRLLVLPNVTGGGTDGYTAALALPTSVIICHAAQPERLRRFQPFEGLVKVAAVSVVPGVAHPCSHPGHVLTHAHTICSLQSPHN